MAAVRDFTRHRPTGPVGAAVPMIGGYRERDVRPAEHLGLPSPYLTIIITLDEPCEIAAHPDPSIAPGTFDTLIGGLHVRPAVIQHHGAQSGVQLALDPTAARAVLGMPAAELVMCDVRADQVLGPAATQLADQIRCAASWDDRFSVVEGFVRSRLADAVAPRCDVRREVRAAWGHLVEHHGNARIDALAAACGLGPRRFAELFRSEMGVSPKTAARLARFDATRRRTPSALAAGRLADLACAMGYADQAHLTREFSEFAGHPPRRWWALESGNVQDGNRARR